MLRSAAASACCTVHTMVPQPKSPHPRELATGIIGPCIWIFKVGKEIPDLSTQQQGTESILVNSESLLFVDLCYGF